MRRSALPTLAALCSLWSLPLLGPGPVAADDANFEFSKTANPSAHWTYGWASAPGAAFQPFATEADFPSGLSRWSAPNGASLSLACSPVVAEPGGTFLAGELSARLGSGGAATALRWTAPANGTWHARATFVSEAGYFPPPTSSFLNGPNGVSKYAASVAVADVDGDGYSDVIIGQPDWTNGQTFEGRFIVYRGTATGPSSTPAWTYESNVAGMHLGASLATGNFNGDAWADLAVGGPGGGAISGHMLLFRGSPAGPMLLVNVVMTAGFGRSVGFGDFDGDGLADLAVLHGGANSVYVWNGTMGLVTATWSYTFIAGTATAPTNLAGAGDLNGDGYGDLLIGAPAENTNTGAVRADLGGPAGLGSAPAGVTIPGDAASVRFGAAVCGVGDVDGDGYGDFLAGAPDENVGSLGSGRVALFRGGAGTPHTTASWTYDGVAGSQTGSALCRLGELNGDGHADFAVGAPAYSIGQAGQGATFVFYGGAGATATLHRTIVPSWANAALGSALAAGDVNGDLCPDLVIGEPGFVLGTSIYGRAMIVYDPGPPPVPFARTSVRVLADGVTIALDSLNTATGRDTVTLEATLGSAAGHTLDFEVSDAGGLPAYETVAVDAAVVPEPEDSNPIGPVLVLGNQRFVPLQGPPAFEAAAFDPAARRLATNGHLYDACGNLRSAGPEGPGIAWDPVTRKFWNIAFDAGNQRWVVSSWDTTTQVLTPVLFVPRVLAVPGTGADTLEDARGIAVDSSFVYVVDAGPAGLQPPANAWFKFTRTGTPVASRKGAAFSVNASGDIVDDIVWSPFASPTEPGRLLVAIEHVGIHVLATDGAFVDSATWRSQGLARGSSLAAFAGLALDPVSGDLFLADNDRSKAQRWVRLTEPGPTTYLVGDGSPGYLMLPVTECGDSPVMWDPIEPKTMYCPQTPFIFGVAYRSVDRRVYAVDYGSGTLWRFDPRGGRGERVGETGQPSIWGLAYDPGRDRLYGLQNVTGSQVWSIQPRTAVATPLPQVTPYGMTDIAFEPIGAKIYGITSNAGVASLVSIDRDTGAGTIVGPTRYASGLDWDPVRGALVGLTSSDSLWSINAGTGAASLIGVLPSPNGWEGLAVVTVSPAGTLAVGPDPDGAGEALALALSVAPQPSARSATFAFTLSAASRVRLELYDLAGRRIRSLADGPYAAGLHTLSWDGRGDAGGLAAAGVYFARVEAGGRSVGVKVVRL